MEVGIKYIFKNKEGVDIENNLHFIHRFITSVVTAMMVSTFAYQLPSDLGKPFFLKKHIRLFLQTILC